MYDNASDSESRRTDTGKDRSALRTSVLIVAVLLAAAVLLHFLPSLFGGARSGRWTEEFSSDVREAEIRSLSCDVILLPAEDGLCRVEYSGSRRYACAAEVKNGTLTVTEKKRLPWFFSLFWHPDTKLTVFLPAGCENFSIHSASGDLAFPEGVTADRIDLDTVSGDISGTALRSGTLTVSTVSGETELMNVVVDSSAAFHSVSGEFSLTDYHGADTSIETISGDVAIFASDMAALDISTTSGDAALHDSDAETLEISTTSGDVFLSLLTPKDYDVSTVSGDVTAPPSGRNAGACRVHTVRGDVMIYENGVS